MFSWYPIAEYWIAAIQLSCAMLGMGATLTVEDFGNLLRNPKGLLVGVILQLLLVPLVCLGFVSFLDLSPGFIVGLFVIAALPGGAISNIFTFLGKGDLALSIGMTAVTTVGCIVTTPVLLEIYASDYIPSGFEMPLIKILRDLGCWLVIPLALGMLVHRRYPEASKMFSRNAILLSLVALALVVIGSLGSGRVNVWEFGLRGPTIVIFLALAIQSVATLGAKAMGLSRGAEVAITVEVTMRNVNLGVLIIASMFPPGSTTPKFASGVLFAVLVYGGVTMITPQMYLWINRFTGMRE